MTIERQLLEKLRDLPPEKQKELLAFVDLLKEKNGGPQKTAPQLTGLVERPEHSTSRKKTSVKLAEKLGGDFPRDIDV